MELCWFGVRCGCVAGLFNQIVSVGVDCGSVGFGVLVYCGPSGAGGLDCCFLACGWRVSRCLDALWVLVWH